LSEPKWRSSAELDELFEDGTLARKFKGTKTVIHGLARKKELD
jgi:hypothetical protein